MDNRDRDFNIRCLVKRLHRVDKEMAGEARADFAAYVPDGDLARFARSLPSALAGDFVETMKLLRNGGFGGSIMDLRDILAAWREEGMPGLTISKEG